MLFKYNIPTCTVAIDGFCECVSSGKWAFSGQETWRQLCCCYQRALRALWCILSCYWNTQGRKQLLPTSLGVCLDTKVAMEVLCADHLCIQGGLVVLARRTCSLWEGACLLPMHCYPDWKAVFRGQEHQRGLSIFVNCLQNHGDLNRVY